MVECMLGLVVFAPNDAGPWFITAAILCSTVAIAAYRLFTHTLQARERTSAAIAYMTSLMEQTDLHTSDHACRVTEFSEQILQAFDRPIPDAALIVAAARMHDVGKSRVPAELLNKPGPLTPEEWEIMRAHAVLGAEAIQSHPDFAPIAEIVMHHHERWDGCGYPHQLRETEIPLGARIIAVADSFDAMTTDRPYQRAMAVHEAADVLRAGRGTQWDATVVDTFLRWLSR